MLLNQPDNSHCVILYRVSLKVLAYTKYQKAYPFDKAMSIESKFKSIFDLNLNLTIVSVCLSQEMATEGFTSFIGTFGQATNCVSFAFSLLGTSFVVSWNGHTYLL